MPTDPADCNSIAVKTAAINMMRLPCTLVGNATEIEGVAKSGKGRKMKSYLMCATFSLMAMSGVAQAGFICTGNPGAHLGVDAGGDVITVVDGAGIVKICNLSETTLTADASPKACAAWYSMLLTLRAAGGKAAIYFDETNPINSGATGCSTLGQWIRRVPYYLQAQ